MPALIPSRLPPAYPGMRPGIRVRGPAYGSLVHARPAHPYLPAFDPRLRWQPAYPTRRTPEPPLYSGSPLVALQRLSGAHPAGTHAPISGFSGLGCPPTPGKTYRTSNLGRVPRLGRFGDTNPWVSFAAEKGAGYVAGGLTSAALSAGASAIGIGATAGSVVPVIGTIVGAVVGLLAGGLFGHANHAQIAQDVQTRIKFAELYKTLCGTRAGRDYTSHDLHQVWYGLVHEGYFPKNHDSGNCNIAACVGDRNNCQNCGGSEEWVDDVYGVGGGGNPLQSFPGAIRAGLAQGLKSPIDIADKIFIPAWAPPDQGRTNQKWMSPVNSNDPELIRQLIIDTLDAAMYEANSSTPQFYGQPPTAPTPSPNTSVPTPVPAPAPSPQPVAVLSAPGTVISPTSKQSLVIPQAVLSFQNAADSAGNYNVYRGASVVGIGNQLGWDGTNAFLKNVAGDVFQWNGTQFIPYHLVSQPAPPTVPVTTPTSVNIPSGFQLTGNANGAGAYVGPNGLYYAWNGATMTPLSGTLNLLSGGTLDIQNGLAQAAQPTNTLATPTLSQPYVPDMSAYSPVAQPAPAPTPVTAGVSPSGWLGIAGVGLAVVMLMFAGARPASGTPKRSST